MRFIIDTGSHDSMLGYMDANMLKVPFKNLNKGDFIGIGGFKHPSKVIKQLDLRTKDAKGNIVKFCMDFSVLKPGTAMKALEEVTKIPSILGLDFLKNNKLKLVIDAHKETAYLECD